VSRPLPVSGVLAAAILVAAAVGCAISVIYFAYHYVWIRDRHFTSALGAAAYFLPPTILAGLFLYSLKLRSTLRVLIAICCVTTVASAYGLEAFFRSSGPKNVSMRTVFDAPPAERARLAAKLTREFNVTVDTRDRQEVIEDLRRKGIEAVPQFIVPPIEVAPETAGDEPGVMPLSGMANVLTVACNQNGQYLTYATDDHGFLNPPGIWHLDHIDIAAVGNAGTLGYCVPPEKNFVAQIRSRYPATINLGMTGEGPLHALGVLKEYAAPLKPKVVLWFYSEGNSLTELRYEKHDSTLQRYLNDKDFSQQLLGRQPEIDEAVKWYMTRQNARELAAEQGRQARAITPLSARFVEFARFSALRQQIGLIYGAATPQSESVPASEQAELNSELNLLRDVLTSATAYVGGWGGKLWFVYIPGQGRYFGNPEPGVQKREEVLGFVRALGVPIVEIDPAFRAVGDPSSLFPFRQPGHLNEAGHRVISQAVMNATKQTLLQ
jgi:hypothetical protein